MDEKRSQIIQQASIGSDSTGEDSIKNESGSLPLDKRICLVGNCRNDPAVCNAAQSFGVPICTSETGEEYAKDKSCTTIFVLETFSGEIFDGLYKSRHPLLGPPAIQQLATRNENLPSNTRPLYNLSMAGVVVCFTGIRTKDELTKLVPLIHQMGGSIRKDISVKVTHLIANTTSGEKYQYAATFRVPLMNREWVLDAWSHKDNKEFSATNDKFMADHKLKPFHGAKVSFVGFPEEEEKHMIEILEANGGTSTSSDDPTCTHIVQDNAQKYTLEPNSDLLSPQLTNIASTSSLNSTKKSTTSLASELFNDKPQNLSTLHEKSNSYINNEIVEDTVCNTTINMQNLDLDKTNSSSRKRKLSQHSPDKSESKRKCDLSYYSENAKQKISNFFKTPFDYISNRRRTIGPSLNNQSLNDTALSSSSAFDIATVENLNDCHNLQRTPSNAKIKKSRKNLFLRTFSSSKFVRTSTIRKSDLNSTKLSFSECDGSMNNSCFPDFSELTPCNSETLLRSNGMMEQAGTKLNHAAVVDETSVTERPDGPHRAHRVKAEWFWTSVQKEICLDEKDYLIEENIEKVLSPISRRDSHVATPSSASRRKRKRLHETLSSLAHQQSPGVHHKRRSSISDAGLLSVSGSFLDCTTSPDKALLEGPESNAVPDTPRKGLTARQQVFLELVQTESNYVNILHTIMTMFKKHLEDMPEEEALLNNTELKIIFGNVPPIYETHLRMLDELRWTSAHWSEDKSIGNIILKYATDLLKAYPPFVNFFEEMKEMLRQCDENKPRFHAFLKACQTRPECGRQGLQDLLIRPVQRLPSISLLLNDILKNTPKTNTDHSALDQALASIREVMTHINEDKRKTEGQRVMFDIFNEIDNCPPDLVSSHRSFVAKLEVIQLSAEGLSGKGNPLVLFLFSDQLEICKKRSKAFNTIKSPNPVNGLHKNTSKPYKHIKLMSLSVIKRVIDIKETDECQKVFGLVCRYNDELKERLFTFTLPDEDGDKVAFLKTLCRQMATNACTADADNFLVYVEPGELDINTSDVSNGTLSKAIKFATRTKIRVGRAFSFNKTPSKLKRAVSSMMSPFGSSTNLTPASQLAQMRLASYNNISELGNADNAETPRIAPLSVQPTRKLKSGGSLGVSQLKRL